VGRTLLLALLLAAGTRAAADDVVTATLGVKPGTASVHMTIAAGWHINAHEPADEFLIPTILTLEPPAGVSVGPLTYPKPVSRVLPFSEGKAMLLYEGDVEIVAALSGTAAAGAPFRGKLRYQACDEERCLPPRTLELTATTVTATAAAAVIPAGPGTPDMIGAFVARWGWPLTFAWVVVLGMALNLTPCVYPLVSVTVAFFGGATGEERRVIPRALVYVLGICLTFSLLGVGAALTGSMFGAALQQPVVLGAIVLLMIVLAASNFGLYQLRMPDALMQRAGRVGEGAIGAFVMGATMGVVAAPCIGPIVLGLLVYVGAQQSVGLGFALFFALAVGLGAPYVALAAVAARVRRLPRSGAWLAWMERLFGFLLLGLAVHFATPLLSAGAADALWAALLVAGGATQGLLTTGMARGMRLAARTAGAAAVLTGAVSLRHPAALPEPIVWTAYSDAALRDARAAQRPVLIDFQAEWCLPCREMERSTLVDPDVVRTSREFSMLRADVTEVDDATTAVMERFAVAGVPTYLVLSGDGSERERLVGFVPAARFVAAMRSAVGG
jgi:thiol:disulfide interchange protein DsbD